MKCGACTDKCHYFLGTGDPKNMPVARQDLFRDVYRRYHTLSGRLVPWLVGAKKLTPEMLDDWYAYFHQCSQCRRCAVYCPVGIDTAEFAMAAREVMDRIGVGQHYTNEVVEKAGRLGNNLGLPGPALADTLAGLEEEIVEDTGVPVRLPLDEPAADVLLVTPSADFFAEPHVDGLIGYAKVFHRAGLSWTLSTHASEAANFALFMGNRDHMAALARRIVEAAREVGASRIVFGECGHAWRVGHNHLESLAGPLDFLARGRVEHVVEVTDELIRRGAVTLDPTANDHRRVTYHDSCNIARASRLGDIPGGQFIVPRRVLRAVCNHYVEMARNTIREATFCCGRGGRASRRRPHGASGEGGGAPHRSVPCRRGHPSRRDVRDLQEPARPRVPRVRLRPRAGHQRAPPGRRRGPSRPPALTAGAPSPRRRPPGARPPGRAGFSPERVGDPGAGAGRDAPAPPEGRSLAGEACRGWGAGSVPAGGGSGFDRGRVGEAVEDVAGDARDVVVVAVVGEAPAVRDGADREHRSAAPGLEVRHVGADERLRRLSRPGRDVGEELLGDDHEGFTVLLGGREDEGVGRRPEAVVDAVELEAGRAAPAQPEIAEDPIRHPLEDPRRARVVGARGAHVVRADELPLPREPDPGETLGRTVVPPPQSPVPAVEGVVVLPPAPPPTRGSRPPRAGSRPPPARRRGSPPASRSRSRRGT